MSDDKPTITIRNYTLYPFQVHVDGQLLTIDLHIKRMTVDQAKEFNRGFQDITNAPSRWKLQRKSDEHEKTIVRVEGRNIEKHVLDDAEIRSRRLLEMTDADRQAFLTLEDQDNDKAAGFLLESIRRYIRVAPGQGCKFETKDGELAELRTGEDLIEAFGGEANVLLEFGAAIWAEVNLEAAQKIVRQSKRKLALEAAAAAMNPPPTPPSGDRLDETSIN